MHEKGSSMLSRYKLTVTISLVVASVLDVYLVRNIDGIPRKKISVLRMIAGFARYSKPSEFITRNSSAITFITPHIAEQ